MFNCASVCVVALVSTCAFVGVVALGSICVSVGVLTFIHLLAFCIDVGQLSSFCLLVQRILILGASCYFVAWCGEASDVITGFGKLLQHAGHSPAHVSPLGLVCGCSCSCNVVLVLFGARTTSPLYSSCLCMEFSSHNWSHS